MASTKIHQLAKKFPNKTYRELELKLQASSTKRARKPYKMVDINKYRNVELTRKTRALLQSEKMMEAILEHHTSRRKR